MKTVSMLRNFGLIILLSSGSFILGSPAEEAAPKPEKGGQEGIVEDLTKAGGEAANAGAEKLADGLDKLLHSLQAHEKNKKYNGPRRSVKDWASQKHKNEIVARTATLGSLNVKDKVEFDDNSEWLVRSNNVTKPDNRKFEMRTVVYESPTEVFGVPLWRSLIQERWRFGLTKTQKNCEGKVTTYRKLPREYAPAGYAVMLGTIAVAGRLLYRALC